MDVNPLEQFNSDLEKLASQTRTITAAIATTAGSMEKHSPRSSDGENLWARKTLSTALTSLDAVESASQELQAALARLKHQLSQRGDGDA